jgi:hypothetical protein
MRPPARDLLAAPSRRHMSSAGISPDAPRIAQRIVVAFCIPPARWPHAHR